MGHHVLGPLALDEVVGEVDVVDEDAGAGDDVEVLARARDDVLDTFGQHAHRVGPDDPHAAHAGDELAGLLVDRARVARVAAVPVRREDGQVRVDRPAAAGGVVALHPPVARAPDDAAREAAHLPAAVAEGAPPPARGLERAEARIAAALHELRRAAPRAAALAAIGLRDPGEEGALLVARQGAQQPQLMAEQVLDDEPAARLRHPGEHRLGLREHVARRAGEVPVGVARTAADVRGLRERGDPVGGEQRGPGDGQRLLAPRPEARAGRLEQRAAEDLVPHAVGGVRDAGSRLELARPLLDQARERRCRRLRAQAAEPVGARVVDEQDVGRVGGEPLEHAGERAR